MNLKVRGCFQNMLEIIYQRIVSEVYEEYEKRLSKKSFPRF